jgi:glycosyltransferase involved in cell wall biosynthesis
MVSMRSRNDPVRGAVWLDVSLLFHCNVRQPTGIPRTLIEVLNAWWVQRPGNLRLCRYHPQLRAYTALAPERLPVRLPSPGEKPGAAPPAGRRSPWRVGGPLRTGVKKMLTPGVVWALRQGKNACWATVRAVLALRKRLAPFAPGDVLVSIGGGWNHPGSGEVCRRLREQIGFRSVHFIHDVIPIKCPQFYRTGFGSLIHEWMSVTCRSSELFLANSRHTRNDVLEYCRRFDLPEPPIEVVRLGEGVLPEDGEGSPPAGPGFDPNKPFVLSVGTVEVRKNHQLLYHAWRRLVRRDPGAPPLVLAGAVGWLADDVLHQMRHDPFTRGHIILLGGCDNGHLAWLYRHCMFTVFPSHYEGWGLPIAESLAFGKYCIASNTSSMPEIGGDLVGAHDPGDLPHFLKLVTEALSPAFLARREEQIRRGYTKTPWTDTARQIAGCIERHFGPEFRLYPPANPASAA